MIYAASSPTSSLGCRTLLTGRGSFSYEILPNFEPSGTLKVRLPNFTRCVGGLNRDTNIRVGDCGSIVSTLLTEVSFFGTTNYHISSRTFDCVPCIRSDRRRVRISFRHTVDNRGVSRHSTSTCGATIVRTLNRGCRSLN